MSIINTIAHSYDGVIPYDGGYKDMDIETKSELLESNLVSICESLAEIENLTDNRKLDVDYLVTIVGSYLMGVQEGTLGDDAQPPSVLFAESLYPSLVQDVEVIKESIDETDSDNTVDEGDGAKDTTD